MALHVLRQIKQALATLNPKDLRESVSRPLRVGLIAASPADLGRMEAYFAPMHLSPERRAEALRILVRGGSADCDIQIYDTALLRPKTLAKNSAFAFDPANAEECVRRVLRGRPELMLPLARQLFPFRNPAAHSIIRSVAKENALFSLATALPDVVPFLSLPWALGEFSSDTAFLTMNQIRMVFMLAAVSDRPFGYREQRSEIGSIIAGAFGWRAIARELIGKVPFGGGLVPKAAIAWAGTYAVGLSMERLYRLGYGLSREERKGVYEEAFEHGKQVAGVLLNGLRQKKSALAKPMASKAS
jgi:hypothetical protein